MIDSRKAVTCRPVRAGKSSPSSLDARVEKKKWPAATPSLADESRRRRDEGAGKPCGSKIKLLKEEEGLTQREMALRLGLRDGTTISRKLSEFGIPLERERRLRKRYQRLRDRIAYKH